MGHNVVAITACAAGIAHTYMAAESLEQGCKLHGYQIKVETQGSIGVENALTDQEIADADLVLIAADIEVAMNRFHGKRVYRTHAKDAIKDAGDLVKRALKQGEIFGQKGTRVGHVTLGKTAKNGVLQHLMSGISYMIPMVIAAGLLLAFANIFAFQKDAAGHITAWGFDKSTGSGNLFYHLFELGKVGFLLMIPLFAGFVANSIADRPAIAPAMIGAYIANDAIFLGTKTGGGFLAAILVAFLVGYFVLYLKKIHWPNVIKPLVPIMIIPLISTLFIFLVVFYLIGSPIAVGMNAMYDGLSWLNANYTSSSFLIGAVIGAMIGFDFGGPINKTAYIFGTAVFTDTISRYGIDGANFVPFTAVNAAISIAPLGVFVASRLFSKRFSATERVSANAACAMGLVGVSEGAIPFAAAHPLQMITASVCGSALAGGLVGVFGVKYFGGIGSPLGTIIGYIQQPIPIVTWVGSTCAGILLTALIIGFWRKPMDEPTADMSEAQSDAELA